MRFVFLSGMNVKNNVGITARSYPVVGSNDLHLHNFYEFEYIAAGYGEYYINDIRFDVRAGDVFGVGMNDYHRIANAELTIYNLIVLPQHVPETVKSLLNTKSFPIFGRADECVQNTVTSLFRMLERTYSEKTEYGDIRLAALSAALLTEYFEISDSISMPVGRMSSVMYIQRVLEYISLHYAEQITLEKIAEEINVSPCYLSSLFTKHTGIRFKEYLNRLRVKKVCEYLHDSSRAVTDIAYSSGFGSLSSMNRLFARYVGMTPSRYRENVKSK